MWERKGKAKERGRGREEGREGEIVWGHEGDAEDMKMMQRT